MIGDDGIYQLYQLIHHDDGRQDRRLVGKFYVYNAQLKILEDHDNILHEEISQGPLNQWKLMWMEKKATSPYWQLIREEDVEQGYHQDEAPELRLMPDPWVPKE
jgi:hypothetical protein